MNWHEWFNMPLAWYSLLINAWTFCIFAVDKDRAQRNQWRISEKLLLGSSLVGGAFGGIVAMQLFRHKTRKPYFAWGLPLMLVMQLIAFWEWR